MHWRLWMFFFLKLQAKWVWLLIDFRTVSLCLAAESANEFIKRSDTSSNIRKVFRKQLFWLFVFSHCAILTTECNHSITKNSLRMILKSRWCVYDFMRFLNFLNDLRRNGLVSTFRIHIDFCKGFQLYNIKQFSSRFKIEKHKV